MPKRLPRARTLKGEPNLAYYSAEPAKAALGTEPTTANAEPSDGGAATADEFAILLVHGSMSRSEDWENIFPRLATRYRTVAFDLRGHGKSGRASSYSLPDFAADAVRVIRGVIKGPTVVIGHSLGSLCAIAAAAEAPELVTALVLEDPPIAYTKSWKPDQLARIRDALANATDEKALLRFVQGLPLASPGPRGERTYGETRGFYAAERVVTYYRDVDPAIAAARASGTDQAGLEALPRWLQAIRCPVLVIAGETRLGSLLDDPSEWKLKQAVKDLTVKRFPGTGHLIHGYRPEQFLENIEPFLRRLRTQPR